MATLERRRCCRDTIATSPLRTEIDRARGYQSRVCATELANLSDGSNIRMTDCLIAARAVIILWTILAVMPAEIVFDAIEAELERRDVER